MSNFPLDLNNPTHARAYLIGLESGGNLSFDDGSKVADLDDAECVAAAKIVFLKLLPVRTDEFGRALHQ